MLNFTEEIKKEIIYLPVNSREEKISLLSAFIRTSGSVVVKNGLSGFELITENERTAEFFTDIIENAFSIPVKVTDAKFDLMSGKERLCFECVSPQSDSLLSEMGVVGSDSDGRYIRFGIDEAIVPDDDCKIAYLRGAFLGGGSCTIPDEETYSRTGYHFEIVFPNKIVASDFCDLLAYFDVLAKLVLRKDSAVVYVKRKEIISDILNILGCVGCMQKMDELVRFKQVKNDENRVNNCSVSNIDKTVTASVKQVTAIEIISQTIGLQGLDKNLFDVATCRLADKNASMQELSDRLGITKSCLNHRMRKILELADSLDQD